MEKPMTKKLPLQLVLDELGELLNPFEPALKKRNMPEPQLDWRTGLVLMRIVERSAITSDHGEFLLVLEKLRGVAKETLQTQALQPFLAAIDRAETGVKQQSRDPYDADVSLRGMSIPVHHDVPKGLWQRFMGGVRNLVLATVAFARGVPSANNRTVRYTKPLEL